MEWRMAQPVLFVLPAFFCLIIHVFIAAGLLVQSKAGFYRFFVYAAGSLFLVFYLLFINYGYTLATTKITIDLRGGYINFYNQYGSVQIPKDAIHSVTVEGNPQSPHTVWVHSDRQTFFIDRKFMGWEHFLPALGKLLDLSRPDSQGNLTVYRFNSPTGGETVNTLGGKTYYYLPWFVIMPFLFYPWAQRAWAGQVRYFLYLACFYFLPLITLAVFLRPTLPLVMFTLLYFLILLFYSAMCLPRQVNSP